MNQTSTATRHKNPPANSREGGLKGFLAGGQANLECWRFEAAISDYAAALDQHPDSVPALLGLGRAYQELSRGEDALKAFERAVQLAPADPEPHYLQGSLLVVLNRYEAALSAYRRAIEADGDHADAISGLCWALRILGRLDEAIEAGRKTVALNPNRDNYSHLLYALMAADHCQAAEETSAAGMRDVAFFSGALAFLPSALEGQNRRQEGQRLVDLDLLSTVSIDPPLPYANLGAFNDALVKQVLDFPTRSFDDTQTRNMAIDAAGPMLAFLDVIQKQIEAYQQRLRPDSTHPFLAHRLDNWDFDIWGTILSDYYNPEPHFHQHSWISGVYYAKVPRVIDAPDNVENGYIQFARFFQYSDRPVPSDALAIKPVEGMMLIFPSYFYHRVLPFKSPDLRISLAFNAIPTQDAGSN